MTAPETDGTTAREDRMDIRYTFTLTCTEQLSRDDKNWLADQLSERATDLITELRDGDSGPVKVAWS